MLPEIIRSTALREMQSFRVSFIGYKSQEVVLGKEDVINFQLEETSEMIEEAVGRRLWIST